MRGFLARPTSVIPVAFIVTILIGTGLLLLPVSRTNDGPNLLVAAFTSVSATCVTGMTVVDTATYWTPFGQVVIMTLVQVGGFGIMTMATLLAIIVLGRLGLQSTLLARSESRARSLGDVRGIARTVGIMMLSVESVLALILTARFAWGYGEPLPTAAWHGVFHSVTAFNNAGFALFSDNLMGFALDPYILIPICLAVIVGGVGFPVYYELLIRWRKPRTWSVHVRMTLIGYVVLFIIATLAFGAFEWNNPATMGSFDFGGKVLTAITGGVMPRSAGFNTIDYAVATQETLAVNSVMMFIGGGSAGTSGGIKVGTFILLGFVIWSEIRGEQQVVVGHRSIPASAQREAVTVALLAVGVVAGGTLILIMVTDLPLGPLLFEATSAFGTTGQSAGVTAGLPPIGQITLMGLMFLGRVGTITTAAALALQTRHRHYALPEERPIVG